MKIRAVVQSRSGFTLVEVLIAGAIMSVLFYALSSQMLNGQKAVKSTEKDLVFNSLVNDIQQISQNATLCTNSLKDSIPASGASLSLMYGPNKMSDVANDPSSLFQNDIRITSLKWARIDTISLTKKAGYITVSANLQGNSSNITVGGNNRTFPRAAANPPGILAIFNIDSVTGKVVSCDGNGATGTGSVATPTGHYCISDQICMAWTQSTTMTCNRDNGIITTPLGYTFNAPPANVTITPVVVSGIDAGEMTAVTITNITNSTVSWYCSRNSDHTSEMINMSFMAVGY